MSPINRSHKVSGIWHNGVSKGAKKAARSSCFKMLQFLSINAPKRVFKMNKNTFDDSAEKPLLLNNRDIIGKRGPVKVPHTVLLSYHISTHIQ